MKKCERPTFILGDGLKCRAKTRRAQCLMFMLSILSLSTLSTSAAFGQRTIVGMSIACSTDHVYTWYSDRTVSVGTSENLAAYQPPHFYSLPFGKSPNDIIEIGIAANDHVYTWYRDSTVSSGTSTDLDKYQPRHPFRLPRFKSLDGVVGMDIACSNDHVYVWFRDQTVSSGTTEDLDKYQVPSHYSSALFKSATSILGIGIAGNDHVYAWYNEGKASSGTSTDLQRYRFQYDYVFGPGPCDISADLPKINGRTVFSVGIRGPSCNSNAEIIVRLRAIDPAAQPRVLIEKRMSGSNLEVPITYACTGNGPLTLLAEVESQGRLVKSSNTSIANCF